MDTEVQEMPERKKSATDNAIDRTAYTIYDVLINFELQDPLQKNNQNKTKTKTQN